MPAVPGDLGGHPADPADVGLAVLLGEGEARAQVSSYDVAVEAGHRAPAVLEDQVVQGAGERRLAAAGETGEEDDEAALVVAGLVLGRRSPAISSGHSPLPVHCQDVARRVGSRPRPGRARGRRPGRRGRAAGRPRRGLDPSGATAAASEARIRPTGDTSLWGAGAVEGEEHDVPSRSPCARSGSRSWSVSGAATGTTSAPSYSSPRLGRGEVQAAEGAVGGGGEGGEAVRGPAGEGQPLGVDQLDLGSVGQLGGQGERDPRVRDVEVGAGCQRA